MYRIIVDPRWSLQNKTGWPRLLKIQQETTSGLQCVISNRDRGLFVILSEDTISVWYCKPAVQLTCYSHAPEHIEEIGTLQQAEWKPDSSYIAVTTSKHYMLFYHIDLDSAIPNHHCLYVQQERSRKTQSYENTAHSTTPNIPAIKISFINQVLLPAAITRCHQLSSGVTTSRETVEKTRPIPRPPTSQPSKSPSSTRCFSQPPSQGVKCQPGAFTSCHHQVKSHSGRCQSGVNQVLLPAAITRMLTLRDMLCVSLTNGQLSCLHWDGRIDTEYATCLSDISLSSDLQYSRVSYLLEENLYVQDMDYSPMLGGYALVLSTGQAIFLLSPSAQLDKTVSFQPHGLWIPELNDASSVAINQKYRLVAFGCRSGEGAVYCVDDVIGSLCISHRLSISSKDYPDANQVVGCVTLVRWTPDGSAIALSWQHGGFAVWSVFGALLVCTLRTDYSLSEQPTKLYPPPIKSMEWGVDGYHLWTVCADSTTQDTTNPSNPVCSSASTKDSQTTSNSLSRHILQFSFVKSALTVNPCMANHEHLFLQREDTLYLNTGSAVVKAAPHGQKHTNLHTSNNALHVLISNKQWQLIPVCLNYLTSNWPIRYSAIDRCGHCIAVAGRTGLAHYALFTRKWKLFGNETQERDMVVTGGLTWWKDFICTACYNSADQKDELRFYPRGSKLDNTFATILRVTCQVLLINTFGNILVVFSADSHVTLYTLERKNTQPNVTLSIHKLQEVSLTNYIPHPICVVGVTLTSLRTDSGVTSQDNSHQVQQAESILVNVSGVTSQDNRHQVQQAESILVNVSGVTSQDNRHQVQQAESILVNVSGKLLMFQRDKKAPQVQPKLNNTYRPLPFCSPSVVATCVENMWTTAKANNGKTQLMEALWLCCGAQGMKVWLPLNPQSDGKTHNFMSRRIMLPFKLDIYPLAVLFEDVVILGAASDIVSMEMTSHILWASNTSVPYCNLERTSQIYLHHILRQLLRRNLGVHALDIAYCCTELPYFTHILELLLHEVLEVEATTKDPIPDPLLPRVAAFIQEFPQFLQTIVHCARKTEVALWPYLFNTVGNPKDLFEECLINDQLETASSYLIILQNLEKPIVSRQHAILLLDATLERGIWSLSRDIVRFLKAIDPSEMDTPMHHLPLRSSSLKSYPAKYPSPPMSPDDKGVFSYGMTRIRNTSGTLIEGDKDVKEKLRHSKSTDPHAPLRRMSSRLKEEPGGGTAEQFYIDVILCRHARKLLVSSHLRDLAEFAGNMDDFQLVAWLRKEKLRAAKVDDFVSALLSLHEQFNWPKPLCRLTVQQLCSKSNESLSSTTLIDTYEGINGLPTPLIPSTLPPARPDDLFDCNQSFERMSTSGAMEVFLLPNTNSEERSTTAPSDTSSVPGETDNSSFMDGYSSDSLLTHELEELSHELANRGSTQSTLELRYLLQILLEAGCLEWAVLIAILLRDALAVVRTVNTASMTDTPLEIVGRMREGLSYVQHWANTECMGYKPFLHKISAQILTLDKIAEQAPPKCRISRSPSQDSGPEPEKDGITVTHNPLHNISHNSLEQEVVENGETNGVSDGEGDGSYDDKSECVIS